MIATREMSEQTLLRTGLRGNPLLFAPYAEPFMYGGIQGPPPPQPGLLAKRAGGDIPSLFARSEFFFSISVAR